jgi:hypothetical protein
VALAVAAVLAVAGIVVTGVGVLDGPTGRHALGGSLTLLDDEPVAAADAPAVEAAAATGPAITPPPSSPVHLVIPGVDLDLPLLAHTPRGGVINPPTLTAGYWIEQYGAPVGSADQATNTLYIAAHSAGRGKYGFDPILDTDHEGSALVQGDALEVVTPQGTVVYTVERTQRYGKDELPGASEVWEAVPGRLILITCFQRSDGHPSTENLVVFAQSY